MQTLNYYRKNQQPNPVPLVPVEEKDWTRKQIIEGFVFFFLLLCFIGLISGMVYSSYAAAQRVKEEQIEYQQELAQQQRYWAEQSAAAVYQR